MSVNGPCAWVSSLLPPPATSHSPLTPNTWPAVSWNSEQASAKSKVALAAFSGSGEKEIELTKASSVAMQSTVTKAEKAFPVPGATGPGDALPLNRTGGQNAAHQGDTLSRMKLERLNHHEPLTVDTQKTATPHAHGGLSPRIKSADLEDLPDDEKDNGDATVASSDEGAGSSSEKKCSPDSRKKMKRFRLTHNQTRFLMSEFTRQAHPDAAHRERLSREIPGLTPRQVQVWFQNRRAKLKRLTSNDRERMLKSRALPDDFDTTQVLRTPFGSKPSDGPVLLTDGLSRLNDDEYVISPLSSASTTGTGFPSAPSDRSIDSYHSGSVANRADLQRGNRGTYPFPRSSSFSEPSFNTGLQFPGRFSRPGAEAIGHPGIPYPRRPMDYAISRPPNGMMVGYTQHRPMEGSVSPTGQQEQPMPYGVDSNQQVHGYQSALSMPAPKAYGGMEMNSHMQPHGRNMTTLQHIPVSDAPDYRPYSYDNHPYSMNTGISFTQANASSLSLPASFPSETHISQGPVGSSEERMSNPPHILDPLRAKFGNQ
ncbi:hypothetical protein AOCH_007311, partial [Aspergillus ochraceoroseus]